MAFFLDESGNEFIPLYASLPANWITVSDSAGYFSATNVETVLAEIGGSLGSLDHGALGGLEDDDHTIYIRHALSTAANDFLVGSGSNTFVKKTLAETGAILEADINHDNLVGFEANEHFTLAGSTIGDIGTKDHDLLDGLTDDDHTIYILVDATRAFTGVPTGKEGGVIPEIIQDSAEPGTTYAGLIWIDTDAELDAGNQLQDADADTKIQVEESADEDIIRFDCGGSQVLILQNEGIYQETLPFVYAYNITEAQNDLTTGAWHKIYFNGQVDLNNDWADSPSWLFTAPTEGYYQVNACIVVEDWPADCSVIYCQIVTTGTTITSLFTPSDADDEANYHNMQVHATVYLDANDTLYVQIYQTGGTQQMDIYAGAPTFLTIRMTP